MIPTHPIVNMVIIAFNDAGFDVGISGVAILSGIVVGGTVVVRVVCIVCCVILCRGVMLKPAKPLII